jgi:2-iminobutanoate/2-iminopropanoate deaminase
VTRRSITAADAWPPAGAYSHAVAVNDTLYCAGQLGRDPATGKLHAPTATGQAVRVLDNLAAICRAAATDLAQAALLTVFLTDLADSAAVDRVIGDRFPIDPPARILVGVAGLPGGGLVEIAAIVPLHA